MNYLPSRPQKSQCNFSSSVCCCNNISCSTCHWPILENMSMGYYCNKPIYVTSHIAATNPKKPERTFIFHTYRFFFLYLEQLQAQETYIFNISPASNNVSSLDSGEKWQTVLFTEMQVGNATPLSIFFLTFLYTFPVCLQPQPNHLSSIKTHIKSHQINTN